jgi:hypothetical protein
MAEMKIWWCDDCGPTTYPCNHRKDQWEREIGKCKCGKKGTHLHVCPFKAEINDDRETQCNCCSKCRTACAEDA